MNESKYLVFEKLGPKPGCKTCIIIVKSKQRGNTLGLIKWWGAWRCYAFFPAVDTLYNEDCLREIAAQVDEETRMQKDK